MQKATVNWSTAQGTLNNQWIKLTFPADVVIRTVRLYGAGSCTIPNTTVRLFSDQAGLQQVGQNTSGPLATMGTDVAFGDIKGRVVTIDLGSPGASCSNQNSLSVAEVEVIASGASVAVATPVSTPASTPVTSNAGGGGGCALNPSAGFDPTIPTIFALALGYLFWKRHHAS